MEEYLMNKEGPATKQDLERLERLLGQSLPQEYRQLLLVANGAEFKNAYIRLDNKRGDWITSYDPWDNVKSQLDTLLKHDNKNNLFVQHQEHLLPIAITSRGNQIFIGISSVYRDKIFITDQDDNVSEDERTVFPVYQIADTLTGFLQLLQPNPEE